MSLIVGCDALLTAISESATTISSPTDFDANIFLRELRALGAAGEQAGEISQPFFAVTGQLIRVDTETIQLFAYPDEQVAAEVASQISPNGFTIGTTTVDWFGTPHFYQHGRWLILYVGDNYELTLILERILGAQFAGGVTPPEI